MQVITLEQVSKSYGNINAVSHLNLSIEQGEFYGFIGPNGAGKSTTIRMLLNFLQPDSGNISVLGLSPQKHDVAIKRKTGYVSAESFMYSDMLVSDLFAFTEHYYKIKDYSKRKKLVEALDIDVNKKFEQLSFGNRKKIAVVCALLHSPDLLILDEPSNGLDPIIRATMYQLLKEEQQRGATIFFSSHVLSEVQKVCTKIGLIKNGQLIKETTTSEFTNVGYREVSIETNADIDFSVLEGVARLEKNEKIYRFLYSGNPNALIKTLNDVEIISIHIEEPEIESVFMHYFK